MFELVRDFVAVPVENWDLFDTADQSLPLITAVANWEGDHPLQEAEIIK